MKHYAFITILLFCSFLSIAQQSTSNEILDSISRQISLEQQRPITLDTQNKFENFITVNAIVVDFTTAWGTCGRFCTAGTLKLKLTKKNNKYKHDFAYVLVGCMDTFSNKLKSKKVWSLKKILLDSKSCFITNATNKFDTNGIPFYEIVGY